MVRQNLVSTAMRYAQGRLEATLMSCEQAERWTIGRGPVYNRRLQSLQRHVAQAQQASQALDASACRGSAYSPPPRMMIPVFRGAAFRAASFIWRMSSTMSMMSPGLL